MKNTRKKHAYMHDQESQNYDCVKHLAPPSSLNSSARKDGLYGR